MNICFEQQRRNFFFAQGRAYVSRGQDLAMDGLMSREHMDVRSDRPERH